MTAVAVRAATSRPERRIGLDRRQLGLIAGLIVVGTGIRLWIAFTNYGVTYDTNTAYIVTGLLTSHPLSAYASLRYPYPPGFFPGLLVTHWIATWTGWHYWAVWKIPAILADAGLAATVAWGLGRLGAEVWKRVAAVALVALGPIFVIVSGYHGQIDAIAILPALAGVIIWRLGGSGRAWQAGLLIGVGTAIKTVPLFMVLALLPTARSRREAAVLIGAAVAVPLVALLPWLVAHQHETAKSLTFNHGVPGLGGLSMLIQPGLTSGWLHAHLPRITSTTWFFVHKQNLIVGIAALLTGAYAFWRRMEAVSAASLIWLVVLVINFNWAYQYFIWGMPFFLLAGRLREVALLQLVLLLPAAELYFHFAIGTFAWAYIPLLMIVWFGFLVAAVALVVRHRPVGLRSP